MNKIFIKKLWAMSLVLFFGCGTVLELYEWGAMQLSAYNRTTNLPILRDPPTPADQFAIKVAFETVEDVSEITNSPGIKSGKDVHSTALIKSLSITTPYNVYDSVVLDTLLPNGQTIKAWRQVTIDSVITNYFVANNDSVKVFIKSFGTYRDSVQRDFNLFMTSKPDTNIYTFTVNVVLQNNKIFKRTLPTIPLQ